MNRTHVHLKSLDEADFHSQVLHSNRAFLVAFWAPWSKPCHVIDPMLLEVAEACAGKIEVVKVNADNNPGLSLWFGVQHIPTLLYFQAGKLCGHLVGTVSTGAILSLLSKESDATAQGGPLESKGQSNDQPQW